MKVTIRKIGNSEGVIIPKEVLEKLGLRSGDTLELRGFFPGFAYQLGVLIASGIAYVEAVLAQTVSYATSMEILAGSVLILGAIVILAGPEAKGIHFHEETEQKFVVT